MSALGIETRPRLRLHLAPYLLLMVAWRILIAVVLAYPIASLSSKTFGAWPSGDAMLFEPGGLALIELVRLHRAALQSMGEQALLGWILMIPVSVVITTLFITAAHVGRGATFHGVVGRSAQHLKPMMVLTALAAVATVAWAIMLLLASKLARSGSFANWVAFIVVSVMILALVLIVFDLARAAIVRGELGVASSLVSAASTLLSHPVASLAGWWARSAPALFLVLAEIVLLRELNMAAPASLVYAVTVHLLALVAITLLRASWMTRALQLVSEDALERRAGESFARAINTDAESAEPAQPTSVR